MGARFAKTQVDEEALNDIAIIERFALSKFIKEQTIKIENMCNKGFMSINTFENTAIDIEYLAVCKWVFKSNDPHKIHCILHNNGGHNPNCCSYKNFAGSKCPLLIQSESVA